MIKQGSTVTVEEIAKKDPLSESPSVLKGIDGREARVVQIYKSGGGWFSGKLFFNPAQQGYRYLEFESVRLKEVK